MNLNKLIHKEYPYKVTLYRKEAMEHEFYLAYDPMAENSFKIVQFDCHKMVLFEGVYINDAGYLKGFHLSLVLAEITGILILEECPVSYEEPVEDEVESIDDDEETNTNQ